MVTPTSFVVLSPEHALVLGHGMIFQDLFSLKKTLCQKWIGFCKTCILSTVVWIMRSVSLCHLHIKLTSLFSAVDFNGQQEPALWKSDYFRSYSHPMFS